MTREECIALLERYGNYEGMGIPNLAGCKEAMLMAAKLLKPQLPFDVEEAAEKLYPVNWGQETIIGDLNKIEREGYKQGWLDRDAQVKLPANLDEAAMNYVRPKLSKDYVEYGERKQMQLTHFDGYDILEAIDFGAEWAMGQGIIISTVMQKDDLDDVVPTCEDMTKYGFKEGDKVIVQIRKK